MNSRPEAILAERVRLSVEPDILEAPAVVDAVDHRRAALHIGMPARPGAVVPEDRPGCVLGQPPFDCPHQLLALLLVGLHRFQVDQMVDLSTGSSSASMLISFDWSISSIAASR